jgi:hypothetical protein
VIQITFVPLEAVTEDFRTARPVRSPFKASWSATLDLIDREMGMLRARNVLFRCQLNRADIRNDGWPRAHAKFQHPGVTISFESRHGPLSYTCVKFNHWQDNVRAIALGLEALRQVERYGIVKRGDGRMDATCARHPWAGRCWSR